MPLSQPNKKEEKSRQTLSQIMYEATRLFAMRGYHKTTLNDIAQAIGKTPGAINHHFDSKEELLLAVVRRLAKGLDEYRSYMDEQGPSQSAQRIIDVMKEHFKRQPEATICLATLASEFAGSPDPIADEIRGVYNRFVDPFEKVLQGHPRIKNPRAAAVSFIGAVQGVSIQGILRRDEFEIEALADDFLNMLNLG